MYWRFVFDKFHCVSKMKNILIVRMCSCACIVLRCLIKGGGGGGGIDIQFNA